MTGLPPPPESQVDVDLFALLMSGDFTALGQAGLGELLLTLLALASPLLLLAAIGWTAVTLARRRFSADGFGVMLVTLVGAVLTSPFLFAAARASSQTPRQRRSSSMMGWRPRAKIDGRP